MELPAAFESEGLIEAAGHRQEACGKGLNVFKVYKRIVLEVSGMRDNRCRELVLTVLGKIQGVVQVEVSLMRGRAVVDCASQTEAPAMVAALEAAGYQAAVKHQ